MAQPNYTLKLTLKQANVVRHALEKRKEKLEEILRPMHPDDGQALREEYSEVERLLRDL